jgi:hypothetical protein
MVLLITLELVSPPEGRVSKRVHVFIDRKRLRNVAMIIFFAFLATIAVKILSIVPI